MPSDPITTGPAPDLVGLTGLPPGAEALYAPADTSNYTRFLPASRRIFAALVIHTPEDPADNVASSVRLMQSPGFGASYSYYIKTDGTIYQLVRDTDAAHQVSSDPARQAGSRVPVWWASGRPGFATYKTTGRIYNYATIGISVEGFAAQISTSLKVGGPQYQSLVALVGFLCGKYAIEVHRNWILPHAHLNNNRSDPGSGFPWSDLIRGAAAIVDRPSPLSTHPGVNQGIFAGYAGTDEVPTLLTPPLPTEVFEPEPTGTSGIIPIGIPKRRALVEIGGFHIIPIGTSGVTRQRQFNPLVVDESLRIRFSITHSFEQNEAPWWIEIYNLANATGQRIIDRGTFFNISAGYNAVGLLCEGVIQNVSISREGQNVLTRLVATGIESAPEISAWMSATWPARTPIRAILEEVARLMGFTLASTAHVPQIANERLRRPYPVNLPAPTVLEFILERYELVASFFCGQLIIDQASPIINPSLPSFEPGHILTDRETALFEQSYSQQIREALAVRTEQAITVNERSGMIGVPKRTETGIEVEMLLNPAISITRLINVESRWLSGIYHLTKVTHSGDTWSGDFRTRAVGEPINQAPTPPFEFRTRSDEG